MQQKSFTKQSRSRTRSQRKRERIRTACMAFALMMLWMMVFMMMGKALDHPAEQPVTYAEYMETFGGDSYGNPQI